MPHKRLHCLMGWTSFKTYILFKYNNFFQLLSLNHHNCKKNAKFTSFYFMRKLSFTIFNWTNVSEILEFQFYIKMLSGRVEIKMNHNLETLSCFFFLIIMNKTSELVSNYSINSKQMPLIDYSCKICTNYRIFCFTFISNHKMTYIRIHELSCDRILSFKLSQRLYN